LAAKANRGSWDSWDCKKRCELENELEKIMEAEELYWQQRGGEKWVLEGDDNTTFYHLIANDRRRKKLILSLEHEGGRN
jgi:hypothetical protein